VFITPGCSKKAAENPVQLAECIEKNRLSTKEEARIRKKIHASEKAFALDTLFKKKAKKQGFNGAVLIAQQGVILYQNVFG